jgi:hypothetical protein
MILEAHMGTDGKMDVQLDVQLDVSNGGRVSRLSAGCLRWAAGSSVSSVSLTDSVSQLNTKAGHAGASVYAPGQTTGANTKRSY